MGLGLLDACILGLKCLGHECQHIVVHTESIAQHTVDFTVLEGLRDPERQKTLMESGASQTLNSRHITGHAVDLGAWVDNQVDWSWPLYHKIAAAMKEAAKELDVAIVCGADWKRFPDGPHFELDRKAYP